MIELDKNEKRWILLIKGQLDENEYPYKGKFIDIMKKMFFEIYGWNPDEDNNYHDYLRCIFNRLLDIHNKISDDKSSSNNQLKEIFKASFYKGISNDSELPIERAVEELCGIIQGTSVLNSDGTKRFELFS